MIEILKAHGSQNDIFIIEGMPTLHFDSTDATIGFVRQLCSRTGPFGGDGVYFVDDRSKIVEALFFNPDGSEAELCGNGLRCVGRLILERRGAGSVPVRIGSNVFNARRIDGRNEPHLKVAIDLPPISFDARRVLQTTERELVDRVVPELHETAHFTAVAVPNPNIGTVVSMYEEEMLIQIADKASMNRTTFPAGVNVSSIQRLGPDEIFVRTLERGAGLTLSCGSGVIGARAVYSKLGLADPESHVLVRNVGGPCLAYFHVQEDGWHPTLAGNASFVYRAETSMEDLQSPKPPIYDKETFLDEITEFETIRSANASILSDAGIRSRGLRP